MELLVPRQSPERATRVGQWDLERLDSRAAAAPKTETAGVKNGGTAGQVLPKNSRVDVLLTQETLFTDLESAGWFTQHPEVESGARVWQAPAFRRGKDYLRVFR
jgi:hypothetical protein